jgi:hypothetical protein
VNKEFDYDDLKQLNKTKIAICLSFSLKLSVVSRSRPLQEDLSNFPARAQAATEKCLSRLMTVSGGLFLLFCEPCLSQRIQSI